MLLAPNFQYSLFVFSLFDYSISQCVSLYVYCTWNILSFLDVYVNIFIKSRKYLAISSSNILYVYPSLFSHSRTPIKHMLVCLIVSHQSFGFCSSFFIFYVTLDNFNWPTFKFIDSSAYSNPLMKQFVIYCVQGFLNSLSILATVDVKSFPINYNVSVWHGQFLFISFFSLWSGYTS